MLRIIYIYRCISVLIGAVNYKSVSLSGRGTVIFTGAKIVGLGVIIMGAFVYIFNGKQNLYHDI